VRSLITGAGGFVGRHLAQHLQECGDALLCLERAPNSHGSPAILWDLAREAPADVRREIQSFAPRAIYHLAAISIPSDCGRLEPTAAARSVNVDGVRRLLMLAESLRPQPRVLVISSAHVYAPVPPDSPRVDEDAPLAPSSAYGKTKLAAERIARAAASRGLPVVVARAFNHTGPGQSSRLMLPQWCRQFARGDDPVVVQCRDAWLDIIDVRDVVRAYRLLMECGEAGRAYNVGGGIARKSGDLLEQLAQTADARRRIQETNPGLRQQAIADITRLTAATGWRPQIDLQTTIADTLADWRARVAADPAA
jgi:GDP-4-dehydro-6-deoxy-D-mannose reductase